MSSCINGIFYLEIHLIIKRILWTVNIQSVRPLVGIPRSLFSFYVFFFSHLDDVQFCCYVACYFPWKWPMKFQCDGNPHTSNIYFVEMNMNNKLMLTFLLRFLFNFYILGLFYSLSVCVLPYVNIRARCHIHTHTTQDT